jgi:hypothetical protein
MATTRKVQCFNRCDRQYQRALNGFRAYRADRIKDEKEARRHNDRKMEGTQMTPRAHALFLRGK